MGQRATGLLPEFVILHGKADKTVLWHSSAAFVAALHECGVMASLHTFADKTHTDGIIEDALAGYNPMIAQLIQVILNDTRKSASSGLPRPLACSAADKASSLQLSVE